MGKFLKLQQSSDVSIHNFRIIFNICCLLFNFSLIMLIIYSSVIAQIKTGIYDR